MAVAAEVMELAAGPAQQVPMADYRLSQAISPIVSAASGAVLVAANLGATIDPITLSASFRVGFAYSLNQTIDPIVISASSSSPRNIVLDQTLSITPYIHFVLTPLQTASLDPFHDPYWIAVEFDLFDGNTPITVRLCNRGVVKRNVLGVLKEYDPRLSEFPVELGTSITVTSYGSPVRGQPNGGVIRFAINDESLWPWFRYHWIGQVFRVYFGLTTNPVEADVDEDLELVYTGRVASLKHDTIEVTVQTTDEAIQWDNPLVVDFYGNTYPIALRDKPKPYLWGYAFSIEPEIENEARQVYGVSHRPGGLDFISEVRVGGIPWNLNSAGPPQQGEWTPDLANGTFTLGSPPLGFDVRCDAQQGSFTVAGLIRNIVEGVGGSVDENYMGDLDNRLPSLISYATTTTPVNLLDAIDDFVTAAGCWWAVSPEGKAIAGVIDVPDSSSILTLDEKNIKSLELNTVHPPAWRIRVGYQRNWSPETSFAVSVLQVQQQRWKKAGQVYNPHYENSTVRTTEPRAVDVPLLSGTFTSNNGVSTVQQRLIQSWGSIRSLYDVTVELPPEEITLYRTVALNYMMVTGLFRITSAIRAIGHGPATLQLWGTIGDLATQPPPGPIVPPAIHTVGIWYRNSGSGVFEVGVDVPPDVTKLYVRGIGGGGGGAGGIVSGGAFFGGGGGGAGGYFEDMIDVVSDSAFDWEVGEGGAGSDFGEFGVAQDGFQTRFGAASGNGGGGGEVISTSVDGGGGGAASGAAITINGGPGGVGYYRSVDFLFDVYTASGGEGVFGGGGHPATTFEPGGAPGSGGGGHVSTFDAPGMPGNAGQIIIIWFASP